VDYFALSRPPVHEARQVDRINASTTKKQKRKYAKKRQKKIAAKTSKK
jgi:hypothetical protein